MAIKKLIFVLLISMGLVSVGSLLAQEKSKDKNRLSAPSSQTNKGVSRTPMDPDELEPEVRIVPRENVTHEEYRINGQLYKIKVTPKVGKPYYLFDPEGKGQFTRSDLEPEISIPTWVIKTF